MCFQATLYFNPSEIPGIEGDIYDGAEAVEELIHVTAFAQPTLPIITNESPNNVNAARWGLVPSWVKDRATANDLSLMTLNARSEDVWNKPSYRAAIRKTRGLFPVSGFIEWHHDKKLKIPHLVRVPGPRVFTLACIWDEWLDKESGELLRTFSVMTTQANDLMAYIHNSKKRMPVIIQPENRRAWLTSEDRAEVETLMLPLTDGILEAWPISSEVSRVRVETERPEVLLPIGDIIR